MNRKDPDTLRSVEQRLTREEGLALLADRDLLRIGAIAQQARFRRNPRQRVTFVVDTNPNYTNACEIGCRFCAFHHPPGDPEAFTHSIPHMVNTAQEAAEAGATTMLLQGGINPELELDYFLDMVRKVKQAVPSLTPHFFSPPEIKGLATRSGLTVRNVLQQLWDAGQRTVPGGGAEILSDDVRHRLSPKKGTSEEWIEVMREAHSIGFRTTATMMYGHLEEDRHIIDHLELIRALQDESGGFTAFVPWSFKPGSTVLSHSIAEPASPLRYLQILAVSRLYLDNFDHIQASWFWEGREIGQLALHFGADDFGGTLFEEHVHRAADHVVRACVEEVRRLIREAGFEPAQRDTLYNILD